MITFKHGRSGEIEIYLDGRFYCTCDNDMEVREELSEITSKNNTQCS